MNDRLPLARVILSSAYAAGMAGGKAAAVRLAAEAPLGERFTPSSRAHPFVALAFAAAPALGASVFAEPVSLRFVGGIVLIPAGLLLAAG